MPHHSQGRRRPNAAARSPSPKTSVAVVGAWSVAWKGYAHQYVLESCTFTPAKEPMRPRALAAREQGRLEREGNAKEVEKAEDGDDEAEPAQ